MRTVLKVLGMCAFIGLAMPVLAGEEEDKAKCNCPSNTAATVAWCDSCKAGVAFGHTTKFEKLIDALAGRETKESAIRCGSCKIAFKDNGRCDHCRLTFSDGKAYQSPVSLALSKGEVVSLDKVRCSVCKTNVEKSKGFCTQCKAGVVAGLLFKDEKDYKTAGDAGTILASAINTAKTCQTCAVAMVTDGTCAQCKISFKGGEPVKE